MKICTLLLMLSISLATFAQQVEYQAFIYTSDDLANDISAYSSEHTDRSIFSDMLGAGLDATKGITSGYVTSFLDMGINAIANLITRNKRNKAEWEKVVAAENICETHIQTVSEINDFYSNSSFDGAMDPKGMRFDGIGCLRKEGQDTAFYISCHIDRDKIYRIINHSKFELVLDTLIISPMHSGLPNSFPKHDFTYAERKDYALEMDVKLKSSWMNEIVQLQKDQELGSFSISIPVTQEMLTDNGFFRYVRNDNEQPRFNIVGESFIVPRSYMGYRDENDVFKNSWGTGEFKMEITIKETCDITDEFRDNWKADFNLRKKLQKKGNLLQTAWQTLSHQKWDEISKSWVITILKAPASVVAKEVSGAMGLKSQTQTASMAGQAVPSQVPAK